MVMVLALAVCSSCTVLAPASTAGVIALYNDSVTTKDKWGYGAPIVVTALLGLGIDILLVRALSRAWSKPMT
jgi:hypothetical protein